MSDPQISVDEFRPQPAQCLPGFDQPAHRYPAYLRQERMTSIEEMLPLARVHARSRYGRSGLGDVKPDDKILIITYPHQHPMVFEAIRMALLEEGAERVDAIDMTDLGVERNVYSAAEGWREITDRLRPMVEDAVEFNVSAAALKRYLDDRPDYTAVFAGEAGRRHWKRAAGKRVRNNWLFGTYEDFISRAHAWPDELWRLVDLRVVEQFRDAEEVHITSPEGTDLRWNVTADQSELWQKGAWQSGHIIGSTLQGIRFAHPVKTFFQEASKMMPTINGVVGGTSNHTGYFPHISVEIESGMIKNVEGGGRYGDLWREVIDRYRDYHYPGFPYKGWAYFNDASIGTNAKSYRQIEHLWEYTDSWTNLPERAQAGVIHFGFGAEHWDEDFLRYSKTHKLPTMHFPHVHNLFCTYSVKKRSTGQWLDVIRNGRLTALDDPDVVLMANALGGAELLEYDWIPAVPGINHPGNYMKDYGNDPVSWIAREQRGEFAGYSPT